MADYEPPIGYGAGLSFSAAWKERNGFAVGLEFSPKGKPPLAIEAGGFASSIVPEPSIYGSAVFVSPPSIAAAGVGDHSIINRTQSAIASGFDSYQSGLALAFNYSQFVTQPSILPANAYGQPEVWNWTKQAWPTGFSSQELGINNVRNNARLIRANGIGAPAFDKPYIWNLTRYRNIPGFDASTFGAAYFQGGVKFVTVGGYNVSAYGRPTVINTTADQFVRPSGIASPSALGSVPGPTLSPRSIYMYGGIHGSAYGNALVQRTPAPYGFDSMRLGAPSIEYRTKYAYPVGFEVVEPVGYLVIRDRAQRIYQPAWVQGAIFGDVAVANIGRLIRVPGEDYFQGSDWAQVESNLRHLFAVGLLATEFGDNEIRNRWPTIAPAGLDALRPSSVDTAIGYALRYIRPSGFHHVLIGSATVTKTPGIYPNGFVASAFGGATVWFQNRKIELLGWSSFKSQDHTVWFRQRPVQINGFSVAGYGSPSLNHKNRGIGPLGASAMALGNPVVQWRNRTLSPPSIFENYATWHMVGTDRHVNPVGFDAARFGQRIIPESQSLYPLGFTNPYGWPSIWNSTQSVHPSGFITVGQQPADRWGTPVAFNSIQHITMFYDANSGLVPPAWPQWMLIENKNKAIHTSGASMLLVGMAQIDNAARPVLPMTIEPPAMPAYYQAGLVAFRVRPLSVQGLEPPHISTWGVVYNDAFVISPSGMVASQFGQAAFENTRRSFPYIGGVDMSAYGTPMIAYRVRTLEIESRYGINPPIIRLPEVALYTRYVEPAGFDSFAQGWASLSIHWTIITPRWTHQDFFGYAALKNLTPELLTRGHNSEEFGDSFTRLEWRPVNVHGADTQRFGLTAIADRDRAIPVAGFNAGAIGDKLKVIRMGAPPYSLQYIWLDGTTDFEGERQPGYGIEPPKDSGGFQVPRPIFNQQVLYVHQSEPSTRFGSHRITANSIRVEPGYGEYLMSDGAMVSLRVRYVTAGAFPMDRVYQPTKARVTPHTIWAPLGAPQQAIANHPVGVSLHAIDGLVNKGVGHPSAMLRHRAVAARGFASVDSGGSWLVGRPAISNRRSYIRPEGFSVSRYGWHSIPGPQELEQFNSSNTAAYGRPSVTRPPYIGPLDVKPSGASTATFGATRIELFNREVKPAGHLATLMGTRKTGDTPFMWQGLRVGPHVPMSIGGTEHSQLGDPWISFRVREVKPAGHYSFISEYQLEAFSKRMKVTRREAAIVRDVVGADGFASDAFGLSVVGLTTQYIRPDGYSETYRKGAHNV